MNLKTFLIGLTLVGATAWVTHSVSSQDTQGHGGEMDAATAAMLAAGTPGIEHKNLGLGVGTWDVAVKHWMDANGPPHEGSATSEITMILGGRFMHETFRSDFMGMPFEGNLVLGYNNVSKEYESIWIDNMSTGVSLARGHADDKGNMEFKGVMRDHKTPKGRPYRMTTVHNADGTVTFRMYDTGPDGKEFLTMENHYHTRR